MYIILKTAKNRYRARESRRTNKRKTRLEAKLVVRARAERKIREPRNELSNQTNRMQAREGGGGSVPLNAEVYGTISVEYPPHVFRLGYRNGSYRQ